MRHSILCHGTTNIDAETDKRKGACMFHRPKEGVRQHQKKLAVPNPKKHNYPTDAVAILQEMYEKETSRLILNGIPDLKWRVKRGVRQGAVISPLLFNLIPEQLT